MAIGAFEIDYDKDSATNRKIGIMFKVKQADAQPPEDQTKLMLDLERVVATLNALFPQGEGNHARYLEDAFTLASVGLVGTAYPETAARALESLKEGILLNEAGRVKNNHLLNLGKWALCFAAAAVLLGAAAHGLELSRWRGSVQFALIGQFCYAWAGAMAGTWVSFGWRKAQFRFDDLGRPEADYLWSSMRLVFTGLQTIIIGLLLSLGVVNVNFGQITTAAFAQSVEMALLVGLLCGFTEQTLPSAIAKQTSSLLQKMEPKAGA
ncbi:MAG: hypothetical protein AB7E46_09215 [Desulfovibrio sp.]|jgi:hypothetical protein